MSRILHGMNLQRRDLHAENLLWPATSSNPWSIGLITIGCNRPCSEILALRPDSSGDFGDKVCLTVECEDFIIRNSIGSIIELSKCSRCKHLKNY